MKNTKRKKYCHIDDRLNIQSEVPGRFKDKGQPREGDIYEMASLRRKAVLEIMRFRK